MQHPCYCVLLRKASRRLTAEYDAALAPHGLTLAQFSLLRNVRAATHESAISLTDLAARLDLDRSTVGRNVRLLLKAGLLTPAPAEDQRESAVTLSPRGTAVLAEAEPVWEQVQERFAARLSPDQIAALRALEATLAEP